MFGRRFREPPLSASDLPDFARIALKSSRARVLTEEYELAALREHHLYLGTLFLVDLLDRIFTEAAPEYFSAPAKILEVGAKDFESAPALYAFFKKHGRAPQLTGIELEPERRGDHGFTSEAAARSRLSALPGSHRYYIGDVETHRECYDFIFWSHPFLDATRLLEWGLAPRYFRPRELFAHVLSLLEPGGVLLIVNQERSEDEAQRALLASVPEHRSLEVPVYFRAEERPAYVHLARALR